MGNEETLGTQASCSSRPPAELASDGKKEKSIAPSNHCGFVFGHEDEPCSFCGSGGRKCHKCPCKEEIAELKEQGALTHQKVCDIDSDVQLLGQGVAQAVQTGQSNHELLNNVLVKVIDNGAKIDACCSTLS